MVYFSLTIGLLMRGVIIMQKKSSLLKLVLCALFTALLAACSQIQIPLPYVPINLALFAVHLAGALLGPLYGGVSVLIYLLLAAVGVPVLAGFRGGFGALMGSTGGYVVGYIFTAVIAGFGSRYWGDRFWKLCVSMTVGFVVCYVFGTIWYMILSGNSLAVSLFYCVWPFIPGDIVKVLLAALLTLRLRKPLAAILQ